MNLSKKQIMSYSAIGGFVAVAGVLGWFLFDAYSGRGEQEEELAQQISAFQRLNEAPVFPSLKTISETKTNQLALAAWLESAREYASRGDVKVAEETPPIFKQRLTRTVSKMRALPGAAQGHFAAAGFLFGFDAYLGDGGVLPDVKDVPRLAAQLDAIKHVVITLVRAGALEVKEVRRIEAPPQPDESQTKGKKKAKKKNTNVDEGPKASCLEFGFVFTARPDAIVKTLNALSADNRFIVVKKFAFKSVQDDIVIRMDADAAAKSAAAASASGSSRRRRRNAAAEAATEASEAAASTGGVVADPEYGSPLQVEMTLAVWDFGTGGNAAVAPMPEKEGK